MVVSACARYDDLENSRGRLTDSERNGVGRDGVELSIGVGVTETFLWTGKVRQQGLEAPHETRVHLQQS